MSRVHDMGGRFGTGPVTPEADGIPQLSDWQARALALTLAAGALGQWNIDMSRHARECLDAKDYMRFSYFEKWLAALADLCVAKGLLSETELKTGTGAPHGLADRSLRADQVGKVLFTGGQSLRDVPDASRLRPGQTVRTRRAGNAFRAGGHTRLPAYAAGLHGRILRCHGAHVFPDANAHGFGERPEPLYAVVFAAAELWDAPEHPRDEVVLDLWHSYLDPT
jgi:nitrile hydratase